MTSRELPPAEWPRLAGTDLGSVIDQLRPTWARIVVVEDGAEIVGCWAALAILHAEGVWIAPSHRGKAGVARRLWRQMRDLVKSVGCDRVITGANTPDIRALLEAHGAQPMPWQEFILCL